jgi:hypothetical protein
LQHIGYLGWPQRWLERGHCSFSIGNGAPYLIVAFSFDSLTEIGWTYWKTGYQRTVAAPGGAVAIDAPLGIEKIHPFIAAAAGQKEQKEELTDNPNHSILTYHMETAASNPAVPLVDTKLNFVLRDGIVL